MTKGTLPRNWPADPTRDIGKVFELGGVSSMPAPIDPDTLAGVIDAIETDRFFEALRDFINETVRIDNCVALVFSYDAPPVILHQWSPQEPNYFQMLYCQGAYILDPFYRANLDDRRGGVYLLDEIAPDSFNESEFYQTYYRKVQMIDEIGLLCPIDQKRTIHLSLGRRANSEHYVQTDLAQIRYIARVIESLLRRHAHSALEQMDKPVPGASSPLAAMAHPVTNRWLEPYNVTGRESEIAAMVLRGHSNTSIGLSLNISIETVKVHRRNLYGKVGISSQAELFMLFINHILEAGDTTAPGMH